MVVVYQDRIMSSFCNKFNLNYNFVDSANLEFKS